MMLGKLKAKGTWKVVHKDRMGKIISIDEIENLVTNEGWDYLLDAALHGSTQISTWYIAPWKTSTAAAATNTYSSPGNTEASSEISEATRQEWAEGASSSQSVTNSTAATITAASAVTIYGFGIVGGGSAASTKGDSAGGGTLFSSGMLASSKTLATGETLDLTYTVAKA
jgi:hypothetical protein